MRYTSSLSLSSFFSACDDELVDDDMINADMAANRAAADPMHDVSRVAPFAFALDRAVPILLLLVMAT